MAPYEALYERPCRSPICWTEVGERTSRGMDLVRNTSEKMDLIQKRLLTVQSWQKSYAYIRRRPLKFEVGDHVFLKVMSMREVVRFGKRRKLSPRFIDPFEYDCLPVGVIAKLIRFSCSIPCLHALEVHSKIRLMW